MCRGRPDLKPIWLMWSVSSSIFHSRQRNSGGEPCMEKWVMMSFSLAMDFHFLYSSSTFFFRLKRDSWGTLFCLKKACSGGRKGRKEGRKIEGRKKRRKEATANGSKEVRKERRNARWKGRKERKKKKDE